jgi:hypothetical protein
VDAPLEPADRYETYMNTRPPSFEQSAIHMVIDTMLEEAKRGPAKDGFHVHIAHLADADSLAMIKVGRRGRAAGTAAASCTRPARRSWPVQAACLVCAACVHQEAALS